MLNPSEARNYVRIIVRDNAEDYDPNRLRNAGNPVVTPVEVNSFLVEVPLPFLHMADMTTDELAEAMESRLPGVANIEVEVLYRKD